MTFGRRRLAGPFGKRGIVGTIVLVSFIHGSYPVCYPDVGRGAHCQGVRTMFDRLVDAVLIFGFPLGVLVGYMWRDRISRARGARYLAERNRAARGDTALSRSDPMKPSMISPRPRWAILGVVALSAFAMVAVRSIREPVLRVAGWTLVVSEPVAPADVIVLSLYSGGAGALEAADLVQSGISKRVAVFMDPRSLDDHEFIRRGLRYEDEGARQIRQLASLGVADVVRIPTIEGGSEGEGQALPQWCDEHQLQSIVFVADRDHSRRVRRVLDRTMKGHSTRVTVQPARYSKF